MIKVLSLGLTRIPRIVLLGIIALKFGVSKDTDSFFLVYGIVLFLVASIGFTTEIFSPSRKTLLIGTVIASVSLLTMAIITGSTLALLFVPYVMLSGCISILIGVTNLHKDRRVLVYTSLPYIFTIGIILPLDITVQGLIIALTATEAVRASLAFMIVRVMKPETTSSYDWSHSIGMLFAVVIGASPGVIDRFFALTLETGSVTILAYAIGIIYPIANVLNYGINAIKSVDPNARTPILFSIMASLGVLLILASSVLIVHGWVLDVVKVAAVLLPFIILSTISTIFRTYFVYERDWKAILGTSILFAVCNIVLDALLLRYGLYGIVLATLISLTIYICCLRVLLKQQKYLCYNLSIEVRGNNERWSNWVRQVRSTTSLFNRQQSRP